jgi:hypothetical protein
VVQRWQRWFGGCMSAPWLFVGLSSRRMDTGVRYAFNGDVSLAFQVIGDGPVDVLTTWSRIWSQPYMTSRDLRAP